MVTVTWKSLTCSVSQHVQALPTEKITKKPIPEEHLILKTTFEALIQRCLLSASDPVGLCGVPSLCVWVNELVPAAQLAITASPEMASSF